MIDPTRLAFFILAAAVMLATPGPAVLYIVGRSIERGRWAGLISALGINTGGLVHVAAATAGVSGLMLTSALAFNAVKFAGAGYLIFLGIRKLLREDARRQMEPARQGSLRSVYAQGIVVNILNPKTALFFLAFLPQFVNTERGHVSAQILTLGAIFIFLAVISDSLWALAAGSAADWLRGNARFIRAERFVTGGIFIGLGLATAIAGDNRTK